MEEESAAAPQNETAPAEEPEEEEMDPEPCTARISGIDYFSEMTILFNAEMKTDFNHSHINSSNVDVYVVPAADRHLTEGFDVSTVNLSWNVASFQDDELVVELQFDSPL